MCLLQISSPTTHSLGRLLPKGKQEAQRQMDTIMYSVSLMSVVRLRAGRIHTLPRLNDPPLPCLLLSLGFPKKAHLQKTCKREWAAWTWDHVWRDWMSRGNIRFSQGVKSVRFYFWSLVSGTRIWRRQKSWNSYATHSLNIDKQPIYFSGAQFLNVNGLSLVRWSFQKSEKL